MNEQDILDAVDAAPDGQLDEAEVLSGVSKREAIRLTNILANMRRQELIFRRRDGERRYYERPETVPAPPVQEGE